MRSRRPWSIGCFRFDRRRLRGSGGAQTSDMREILARTRRRRREGSRGAEVVTVLRITKVPPKEADLARRHGAPSVRSSPLQTKVLQSAYDATESSHDVDEHDREEYSGSRWNRNAKNDGRLFRHRS